MAVISLVIFASQSCKKGIYLGQCIQAVIVSRGFFGNNTLKVGTPYAYLFISSIRELASFSICEYTFF